MPVSVPLSSEDGFQITADLLERYITPKTKLLMVNSPNNPTGRVLTRAEIDAIVYVACRHDLYVLSDEIYEHIIFGDHVHYSLAAEPGMAERTIIVNGFSKAYAMTGWRLGWLAAPQPIVKLARIYQTHSAQSAASFTMAAGVAALTGPQECIKEMVAVYDQRRKLVLDAFEEIPGIECPPVEGAFYVFPRFTHSKKSSLEITQALIDEALVVSTPGSAFGAAGEGPHPLQHCRAHQRPGEDGGPACKGDPAPVSGEIKERTFDVRVLLIRHGQSANNVLAETQGHDYAAYMAGRLHEPPLSEIGQRQAELLAEKLAAGTANPIPPSQRLGWVTTEYPIERLYVSPMLPRHADGAADQPCAGACARGVGGHPRARRHLYRQPRTGRHCGLSRG